jgi:hypothetical protein
MLDRIVAFLGAPRTHDPAPLSAIEQVRPSSLDPVGPATLATRYPLLAAGAAGALLVAASFFAWDGWPHRPPQPAEPRIGKDEFMALPAGVRGCFDRVETSSWALSDRCAMSRGPAPGADAGNRGL